MLEQKHNEEPKADAANSQPAYCKTDVSGCVSSPENKVGDVQNVIISSGVVKLHFVYTKEVMQLPTDFLLHVLKERLLDMEGVTAQMSL